MKWWFSSWNLFLFLLSKVCRIFSADCFYSGFTASQSTLFCEAKYSVLHLWNKWNALYDKTGLPKKICVAKIFWEKEQPLKRTRRRKAVWIKGRVATQWATLCSMAVCFAPHSLPKFAPVTAGDIDCNFSLLNLLKDDKKPLIFFYHRLKHTSIKFSFSLHKAPPILFQWIKKSVRFRLLL